MKLINILLILLVVMGILTYIDEQSGVEDTSGLKFNISVNDKQVTGYSNEHKIRIDNSYLIDTKDEMEIVILSIDSLSNNDYVIKKLDKNKIINEWESHNLMYRCGFMKSHTESVDIKENKWYTNLSYSLISLFY